MRSSGTKECARGPTSRADQRLELIAHLPLTGLEFVEAPLDVAAVRHPGGEAVLHELARDTRGVRNLAALHSARLAPLPDEP